MEITQKLKSIEVTPMTHKCNLKIGTLHDDSLFRYIGNYTSYIEKKKDTTSISFVVPDKKYKFTLYLRNFNLIYQSSIVVYYIRVNGAPGMFKEVQDMSETKWFQVDIHDILNERDTVFNLAFPYILIFRVEFDEYFDHFDNFIDKTKCRIESREISDIEYEDNPLPPYTSNLNLIRKWEVKYMVLVLLTYNYLSLDQFTQETMNLIQSTENSEKILEEFFNNYENYTEERFIEYRAEEFTTIRRITNGENRVWVRKVRFTPSGLIFDPPEMDVSNRVIRKFQREISEDFYLRVSIEDENSQKRIWRLCSGILAKFKSNLEHLEIVGRNFEFLGFSNSQMKNHSCWMIARESGYTADMIRSYLGDFTRCKNNSKYASRLGLCFSGTYKTIELDRKKIPDIERNGYCFTDGIGKISVQAMELVKEKLGIIQSQHLSAIQVRIGGCKGVLAVNNECQGVEVRPSMDKFGSDDSDLEVCSYSAYRIGYLNRQIILLLEGLLVNPDIFINLQMKMTEDLDKALVNEVYALKMLGTQDNDLISNGLKYMLNFGVKIQDEPYLQRMLTSMYRMKIEEVKSKARIFSPMSLILMGVVDEYAILKYGQVFLFPSSEEHPIEGECLIAKNPCLHPGDIKVLQAINIPQLHYLRDVCVFPQLGHRPHPNECSGSDLDGDMYFVSWNPELIPLTKNELPMDYQAPPEKEEKPSINGVLEFFTKYMESENLGNIANTHLAQADKHGIYHTNVITLAELHSKAVDYPKTGVPAIIPNDCRIQEWPDFMEKEEEKSYKSNKVLGRMYRLINENKIKDFIPLADGRYLVSGYKSYLALAKIMYKRYSHLMKTNIRQFDTMNEFNFLAQNPGERVGKRGRYDSKEKMAENIKEILNELYSEFHKNAELDQKKRELASACYWVAYSREKKRDKFIQKFLSFPWIFYKYLL